MERAPHLKLKPYESSVNEQRILIIIILLFHAVGLVGLSIPLLQTVFLQLVPWHILLMLLLILISHKPFDEKILLFAMLIFVAGFCLEWIGVHKHWLFGNYRYGNTLGLQLFDIPLIISVNWFLLIYSVGVLLQRARVRNLFIRVIIGAVVLVLLDLMIEPVAIRFDYWHWTDNVTPLKNYLGWFMASVVMLFVFEKFDFKKQSIVAPVFLLVQFLFFAILNLF